MSNQNNDFNNMSNGCENSNVYKIKNIAHINYEYQKSSVEDDLTSGYTVSNITNLDIQISTLTSFEINHIDLPVIDESVDSEIKITSFNTIDAGEILVYKFKAQSASSAKGTISNNATISVVKSEGDIILDNDIVEIPVKSARLFLRSL